MSELTGLSRSTIAQRLELLLDSNFVASIGASLAVADRSQFAVGLHNATDFLRASTDGRVEVLGRPLHQGRTQQLWLVTITDGDGRELARGQVRLQNVDRDRAG